MTKTKRISSSSARYKKVLKVALGATAVFVCGYVAFIAAFINIGYIEQSLDPVFLPTAEYLYAHPQPTLIYVQIQSQISEASPELCYDVWRRPEGAFLNMVRLPFIFSTDAIIDTFNGTAARRSRFCYDAVDLVPGLHLMELRFKDERDTPIIYQWAVMVKE
jgi:hypothetical protein